MSKAAYNIYMVGLGGQGILTIGDVLSQAALRKGIDVNFYPTKGMSQRGGFVQGQLRLGDKLGPALPPKGADLVIAMERSEALKGVRFAKEDSDFLLFDDNWYTTAVLTNKAAYPAAEMVQNEIKPFTKNLLFIGKDMLPELNGRTVFANMFVIGVALARTRLQEFVSYSDVAETIRRMFPKAIESNLTALEAGYKATESFAC
ncbi:MAG: 2-oxoacid:acceptor oxidoreductase family protein [Candidatus Pelethousia sp.]|nr:2-oxoacid:acceptor oxidoreductase family protein [Candidatus Pelethousia sp.]